MSAPAGAELSVSETVCASTAAEPLLTVTSVALPFPVFGGGTVALPVLGGGVALPVFGGGTVALPVFGGGVTTALPVFGGGFTSSLPFIATTFSLPVSGSG